jgi:hypothetical protein
MQNRAAGGFSVPQEGQAGTGEAYGSGTSLF